MNIDLDKAGKKTSKNGILMNSTSLSSWQREGIIMNKLLPLSLAISLVTITGQVHALSSGIIDTEALAMGGAGVSSATENLGHINPALVRSATRADSEFYLTPMAHYFDNEVDDFSQKLELFQGNPTATSLQNLDGSGIYHSWAAGFGVVLHSPIAVSTVYLVTHSQSYSELQLDNNDLSRLPGEEYTSTILSSGMTVIEAGVSYSSSNSVRLFGSGEVLWGLTAKVLTVIVHETEKPVESATIDGLNTDGGSSQSATLDLGFFKEWGRDWAAGIAIKNLIPVPVELSNGETYRYGPQARVGITKIGYRHRIAFDLDLIKSQPLGIFKSTQMASLGIDYDLGGYLKLRSGVNFDLQGAVPKMYTAGMSINSQYLKISFAIFANNKETKGLGVQTTIGF